MEQITVVELFQIMEGVSSTAILMYLLLREQTRFDSLFNRVLDYFVNATTPDNINDHPADKSV